MNRGSGRAVLWEVAGTPGRIAIGCTEHINAKGARMKLADITVGEQYAVVQPREKLPDRFLDPRGGGARAPKREWHVLRACVVAVGVPHGKAKGVEIEVHYSRPRRARVMTSDGYWVEGWLEDGGGKWVRDDLTATFTVALSSIVEVWKIWIASAMTGEPLRLHRR